MVINVTAWLWPSARANYISRHSTETQTDGPFFDSFDSIGDLANGGGYLSEYLAALPTTYDALLTAYSYQAETRRDPLPIRKHGVRGMTIWSYDDE